jgi:hypothetical protein
MIIDINSQRTKKYFFFIVILSYILLSALVIGANPFVGETSAPMDILGEYQGWSSHQFASAENHPARSDILDVFIPQWLTLKEALRAHEYGIWNSVSLNGVPGILDISRSIFTPSFLAFLIIDEHWLGFYFSGLIKLVIAAVGTFLFLRLFVGSVAAFFGGAIYAYSGFNAAWFYWPQVSTSPWVPWLLWACAGWYLFRDKTWLLLIIFTTVMLLLGGFPAVAVYGLYSSMLFALLFSVYKKTTFKNAFYISGFMLTSIAVAFLITSIPLLALFDALDLIDLDYRSGGTPFIFPKDLALLFNPHLYISLGVEKTLYVGKIALILSITSIFLLYKKKASDKRSLLILFSFVLLLSTIVIAFGLIPHELIRLIPAVGHNPWNRLIVITGLAIAILAAITFDWAIARTIQVKNKVLKIVLILGLLIGAGYQIYDQGVLFREFNNIAVKKDFFPSTPGIDYVRGNLKNLQSVVADKSFLISGTLGAYGISEWFAHGFRTDNEKDILKQIVYDPFPGPTAARFSADDIRFDNDLFSKLGIRYVLVKSYNGKLIRSQLHGGRLAAPAMPKNRLAQSVLIKEPISLTSIGLVLATYRAKQAPSDVFLEVVSSIGDVLAKSQIKAELIQDNEIAVFDFEKSIELLPGSYELRIGLVDDNVEGKLTAWFTKNVKYEGDLIHINDERFPGALLYSFYNANYLANIHNGWRVHEEINDKITVVENMNTPDGAYFVQNMDPKSALIVNDVHTERHNAEKVVVNYIGNKAGYIVLPIRWFSGWVAYQNGLKQQPESYLGMLLAIKVNGPSEIKFSYEPTYLSLGFLLTFVGFFCVLLICFFDIKKVPYFAQMEKK